MTTTLETRAGLRLAAGLCAAALTLPALAQDRPRILVTNDDGIEATGLAQLVAALSEIADVVVAAPAKDTSWSGRSKTIPAGMLRLREARIEGAEAAYALEGTPVDAVHFGLVALGEERAFDAVVAGVNFGVTLGSEAYSTGVVGAALEAASLGVPAIAVAQDRRAHLFDVATGVTRDLLQRWLAEGLAEGVAVSINVPAAAADNPRGLVVARLGSPEFAVAGFHKVERDDPRQMWRIKFKKNRRPERETDLDWYQRGEIVVTPLRADGTAHDALEPLAGWELSPPARD
ncbi:MAG: 5'/3'-nucleotidase SurE [Thermoanaerobaculia bacterium]|nr:5'/3'-nucleotidase SurE [Thermoanaerobaculia bacterium]